MKKKEAYITLFAVIMTIMLIDEMSSRFITFIPHLLKYKIKTFTRSRFATLQAELTRTLQPHQRKKKNKIKRQLRYHYSILST